MHASSETHSVTESVSTRMRAADISDLLVDCLDRNKAEDIVSINLSGKTSVADFMIIANGNSHRQVSALADYVIKELKTVSVRDLAIEGKDQADWVLIDAGDIIIHLFRPEVRGFYNLDKMWTADVSDEIAPEMGPSAEQIN